MPGSKKISGLLMVLIASPAMAETMPAAQKTALSEEKRLVSCLSRIETDPGGAYEEALAWLSAGGRPLARHCTALALLALGHHEEAAARLESLANAKDAGSVNKRALYLAQAGNAWISALRPEAAQKALDAGLRLVPDEPGMLKDRARAKLLLRQWQQGEADLNKILQKYPNDPEALYLRAQSRLQRGQLHLADKDIAKARKAAPRRVDILVLRGQIKEAIRKQAR